MDGWKAGLSPDDCAVFDRQSSAKITIVGRIREDIGCGFDVRRQSVFVVVYLHQVAHEVQRLTCMVSSWVRTRLRLSRL